MRVSFSFVCWFLFSLFAFETLLSDLPCSSKEKECLIPDLYCKVGHRPHRQPVPRFAAGQSKRKEQKIELLEKESEMNDFLPSLSAECEPLLTAAGCVNVSSGHFFQIEQDLVDLSIDPLPLTRFYDSHNETESMVGLGYGTQFPLWASDLQPSSRHAYALISEREGFLLPYRSCSEKHKAYCEIDPRLLKKGYTNVSRAALSGQANFVNWTAIFRAKSHSPNHEWAVQMGNGGVRLYGMQLVLDKERRQKLNLPTKTVHLLTEEKKPNGNRLLFSYQKIHGFPRLVEVKTVSREQRHTINTLSFEYGPHHCLATHSSGGTVHYHLEEQALLNPHGEGPHRMERKILKRVRSSDQPTVHYQTLGSDLHKVKRIDWPEGRFLEVEYDQEGKVQKLFQPVGKEGRTECTHHLTYDGERTIVKDPLQQTKVYVFDDHLRLSRLEDFDSQHQLLCQKRFEWSQREGQEGWLRSKSIGNGNSLAYLKTYRYDSHGNVIRETTYGNLTGEKQDLFTKKEETDSCWIEYRYTDDERHLIQEKRMPEGWTIHYTYLPHTNLCTKKVFFYEGAIQERFFYTYGDLGELKTVIEDDGQGEEEQDLTGVTFRRLTVIDSMQKQGPSFGKPQEKRHYFHTPQGWKLLNRMESAYDERGNETKRRFYDENGFCYKTKKTYDSQRRVIEEKNERGQTWHYAYDANGNKIEETLIGSGLLTTYTFDLANRCTKKEEKMENGTVLSTIYTYNALNQLTSVLDPYGNETTYSYDALGRETACHFPPLKDLTIRPSILKEYTLLDQMTKRTDEEGQTTCFRYNLYGNPIELTFPDGEMQSFTYSPSGQLKQKTLEDGRFIRYAYSSKGQLTLIEWFASSGSLIATETRRYKGPFLIERKERTGVTTHFFYDGAGRKIKEENGQQTIHYAYDGFDRLIERTCEGQIERFSYDSAGRQIAKTCWDQQGHLFTEERQTYDLQGNLTTLTIRQNEETLSSSHFHYSPDGTLQKEVDPLGQITEWENSHHHLNGLGQRVFLRLKKDALGRTTHEVEDPWHRLVRRDIRIEEKTLSSTHFYYDNLGHLVKEHVLVMKDDHPLREYFIERQYNSRGWLLSETEQPEQKTTSFVYDRCGRLIEKKKPDGVSLFYTYDPLSRLLEQRSSDGSVHYQYRYDTFDTPVEIVDLVSGLIQTRTYNPLGQLIEETLSPGIKVKFQYDTLDRIIHFTLPDNTAILYEYDAFHLRQLKRLNSQGEVLYTYHLEAYDCLGNPRKELSPAGPIIHTYDALGRASHLDANEWQEKQEGWDATGNLLKLWQKNPSEALSSEFAYDLLDHLIQDTPDSYVYDSLGNCLYKNGQEETVNALNQTTFSQGHLFYDPNGNLIIESTPPSFYRYDALNRLIYANREGKETTYVYDAFNRCLQIHSPSSVQSLVYQGTQEIGSLSDNTLQQLRVIHPTKERTFAIELQGETFFAIQDFRGNVCALKRKDGTIAEWVRYSAFGEKRNSSLLLKNPWLFANRREISGLSLFTHRFYHPRLRRWMTPDPLGFEAGPNLYLYAHNHPFYYKDLDGRFAIAIPILHCTIGAVLGPLIVPTLATVATAAVLYSAYQLTTYMDGRLNQVQTEEEEKIEEPVKERDQEKLKFPENPDDLLPELPRDKKGHIYPADNIRIRPEKHEMHPGETYNPRHHGQHYHVENRRDPNDIWRKKNLEKIKPNDYQPGIGTGFLPGENFPGAF